MRGRIRLDLKKGDAHELVYQILKAIEFPELDDEGGVYFFEDGSSVYCLSGQKAARTLKNDFRTELVETKAPFSGMVLALKTRGDTVAVHKARTAFSKSLIFHREWLQKTVIEVPLTWADVFNAANNDPNSG